MKIGEAELARPITGEEHLAMAEEAKLWAEAEVKMTQCPSKHDDTLGEDGCLDCDWGAP